jgi:WG containing repeat
MRQFLFFLLLVSPILCISQKALLPDQKDSLWGYVNMDDQSLVISHQYNFAEPFNKEGYARVRKNRYWGMLDENGKEVLGLQYDSLRWLPLYYISKDAKPLLINRLDGKYGIMDQQLKQCLPNHYDEIVLLPLEYITGVQSIIRQTIPSERVLYFKVRKGKDWGLVDEQNKELLPLVYQSIATIPHTPLELGQIVSMSDSTIVYRESATSGRCGFDFYSPPSVRDLFIVEKDGVTQIINKAGKTLHRTDKHASPILYTADYKEVNYWFLVFKENNKFGAINKKGKTILPFEYDQITHLYNDFFKVAKNDTAAGIPENSRANRTKRPQIWHL